MAEIGSSAGIWRWLLVPSWKRPVIGCARGDHRSNSTEPASRPKELSARSALWQQVLNDSVADLSADADHDLRMRTRTMLKVRGQNRFR